MTASNGNEKKKERTSVERLVDIADAIFERAVKLDDIKLTKKDEETEKNIADTRDDAFRGVIAVWRLIVDMLPKSSLEFNTRKELEIDAYKVISRCHHRLGNLERARKEITKAIDLGYVDGFISLGAISIDMDDTEGAEKAFRSALAKEAQSMRAHAGLGELYFSQGTAALRAGTGDHTELFARAEEEFMAAGKERFAESYERAMELFDSIGWKDKALSLGEKAVEHYSENRLKYADRLRSLDGRMRQLAGEERYERILSGISRRLGQLMGGTEPKR